MKDGLAKWAATSGIAAALVSLVAFVTGMTSLPQILMFTNLLPKKAFVPDPLTFVVGYDVDLDFISNGRHALFNLSHPVSMGANDGFVGKFIFVDRIGERDGLERTGRSVYLLNCRTDRRCKKKLLGDLAGASASVAYADGQLLTVSNSDAYLALPSRLTENREKRRYAIFIQLFDPIARRSSNTGVGFSECKEDKIGVWGRTARVALVAPSMFRIDHISDCAKVQFGGRTWKIQNPDKVDFELTGTFSEFGDLSDPEVRVGQIPAATVSLN